MVTCIVEFDLIETGFREWIFMLAPSIFVVIGIGVILRGQFIITKVFGFVFTVGSAYLLYTFITNIYGDYERYVDAYNSDEYSVVEGRVGEFREEGVGDRRREFVTVAGQEFNMSGPGIRKIGYNKRSIDGGVLLPERYVKIWHVKGAIIRLEVCT